ncbi:autophagy protein 16- interacts with Atg12p-Atg5p [Apiospora kogelbergensis]|uniref:autophagy protein 16- interacts with Atg12p-Atg5p n=1 Tax=Apiospora kogelbergensis TaxID=1337665 RepID=UPI00312EFA0D
MPNWRDEYLVNLQEAERNNPVNRDLVAACSQLADRVASLEAEKAVLAQKLSSSSSPSHTSTPSSPPTTTATSPPPAEKPPPSSATAAGATTPNIAQLRLELAEALRSKGQLEARFKSSDLQLQTLRSKSKVDDKRIHDLTAERNTLATKLKDRNEELVGKTKLLKEVQDENLTLTMEINMTEQKAKKVADENKELVDRWMKRMAQEADAMNLSNEPGHRKGR